MNIKNKCLVATIGFVIGLLVIGNIVLIHLMLKVQETLETHNEIVLTVPPELQEKIVAVVKKDIECSVKELRVLVQESIDSKLNWAKKNADNAVAQSKKILEEKGDSQLALVYAWNAVGHDSSNAENLKHLVNLVFNKQDLTLTDIEGLSDALEVAMLQVESDCVEEIVMLKKNVIAKSESLMSQSNEDQKSKATTFIQSKLYDLREGRLSLTNIVMNNVVNDELLRERVDELSLLLSEDADMLSESEKELVTMDLEYATKFYTITKTLFDVKNAVDKATKWSEKTELQPSEILTARSQLQTATSLLSQVWLIDLKRCDALIAGAEDLQKNIWDIEQKLNVLASRPAKEAIEKLVAECLEISADNTRTFTSRMDDASQKAKELAVWFPQVEDLGTRNALIKHAAVTTSVIEDLGKKRYLAYQKWATGVLNKLRLAYNDETVVSNQDARNMFDNHLMEIDTSLLLPEVATFYNGLYQLVYDQLPSENKAEKQYQKAISPNLKKLEDF